LKGAISQCRPDTPPRILLINGSSRSEHTRPGEMSKSFRLAEIARAALAERGASVQCLDLSRFASEYGRISIPARHVSRPLPRRVIGRAPVIRTTRSARRTTG
jgi:hypothetical protein